MVALVLDLVTGDLMEVTNEGIYLSNGGEVEDLQNWLEVLLHVVVKEDLEVHWVEEGLGARIQWEVVLGVTQTDNWHLLLKSVLNIVGVFQIPYYVGWVDFTEPFNSRDSRGQVYAGLCHNRFVTPLSLPEKFRAQHVAAVILEELVRKTLLSIVNLSDHVLRTDQISHVPISHVDALEQVVVLYQIVYVWALLALKGLDPIEQFGWRVHSEELVLVNGFGSCGVKDTENWLQDHLLVLEYVVIGLICGNSLEKFVDELVPDLEHGLESLEEVPALRHLIPQREAILLNTLNRARIITTFKWA
jgi:hypothetical protein